MKEGEYTGGLFEQHAGLRGFLENPPRGFGWLLGGDQRVAEAAVEIVCGWYKKLVNSKTVTAEDTRIFLEAYFRYQDLFKKRKFVNWEKMDAEFAQASVPDVRFFNYVYFFEKLNDGMVSSFNNIPPALDEWRV